MTPLPVVSVRFCTRIRPDHLERAGASVVSQASGEVEIIVVDHSASTPVRQPAIDVSVSRLSIGDRSRGAARQRGLLVAQGQLIAYCDDTDLWQPGHLRMLRSALEADSSLAAVYGESVFVDEQLSMINIPEPGQWPFRRANAVHLLQRDDAPGVARTSPRRVRCVRKCFCRLGSAHSDE